MADFGPRWPWLAAVLGYCYSSCCCCVAERARDEIEVLPGWAGGLPSRQFSGMVDTKMWDGQMHQQHYWLVESERDPKNDPLLVWYQGGPGASSMFGYLVELGPFWLTGDSLKNPMPDGTPRLQRNNFSWANVANLLFVDFPAPVGFSQCGSNASCVELGCCNWGNGTHKSSDFTGAEDNYAFLTNWFEAFPQYYDNELYIVGESYAGTYVPLLVDQILTHNLEVEGANAGAATGVGAGRQTNLTRDQKRPLPLKGMAIGCELTLALALLMPVNDYVTHHHPCSTNTSGMETKGNGVVGSDVGNLAPYFNFEWFHGHGQFSEKTYRQTVRDCCGSNVCTVDTFMKGGRSACYSNWTKEVAGYYQYNLYDTCNHTGGFRRHALRRQLEQRRQHLTEDKDDADSYSRGLSGGLPEQLVNAGWTGREPGDGHPLPLRNLAYPCGGEQAMDMYEHRKPDTIVKAALHVPHDAVFYDSDGMGAQYTYGSKDQRPWYQDVVPCGKLRILVYSGDVDTCVNTLWSEWWTSELGFTEIESWRAWTMDNETAMAGYVTRYEHSFDFLTVRGAGHMVPQMKPAASLEMIEKWLANEPWLQYNFSRHP